MTNPGDGDENSPDDDDVVSQLVQNAGGRRSEHQLGRGRRGCRVRTSYQLLTS